MLQSFGQGNDRATPFQMAMVSAAIANHGELMRPNLVERITAAGAVFVGAAASETLGDYAAGPSHVLPTDGAVRAMGGLTTASFMTSMSVQTATEAGARGLAPITSAEFTPSAPKADPPRIWLAMRPLG